MKPPKLHPALLGGLFIGILSALPYVRAANSCCCLWLAAGGVVAAWLMQQNHPRPVSLGDGAVVGLLAAIIGAVVKLAAAVPIALLIPSEARAFSQGMLGASEGMPPEVRELVRSIPPAVFAVLEGLLFLAMGGIVSTVGGVLGAAFFRRAVPAAAPAAIPASDAWQAPVEPPPLPPASPPPPAPPVDDQPAAGGPFDPPS
jgi:hypothetical protein